MQFDRIQSVIDIPTIQHKKVTIVGAGGSAHLIENLTRSGVQHWKLVDPDRIEPTNIVRQGHNPMDIGVSKVEAVATRIKNINPLATVECFPIDFTSLNNEEVNEQFGDTGLFIFATDHFPAQARGNEVALWLNQPAIWIGLSRGGLGGEVVFWHPELVCCFRCLCSNRYEAQSKANRMGQTLDPSSNGVTIFDVQLIDAIAGQICLGLLTRGSDNRFGRLINQLGNRQFIQVSNSPDFRIQNQDVVREYLGIETDCPAYFAWNTACLNDPDAGRAYCPDCEQYRGRTFSGNE